MSDPEIIRLITTTKRGKQIKVPVTIQTVKGRIEFLKSDFALKDEIKAMSGSKWHGYDEGNKRKIWSVKDCTRNRFQLDFMQGKNPYTRWEKPLQEFDYERPLRDHQKLMSNFGLTYQYCILAAEMGTGKTLSAIEIMEQSGHEDWWWVGPKSGLKAVEREFKKWGLTGVNLKLMTYEALRTTMKNWVPGEMPPHGVVFDESSRLKNGKAKRTLAAQALADGIREAYGRDGFVIEMSGTPSPKSPVDWWAQAEIAAPGFLREGSMKAFEWRMGVFVMKETSQGVHPHRVTWLDDEEKCAVCGGYKNDEQHVQECYDEDYHQWEPSFNEVSYLYERLEGLVLVLHKKDCLDLPEKQYRTVYCDPSPTTQRVAKALVKISPNAITGLTALRELSDGFQYREEIDGTEPCPVCAKGDTPGKTEIWVDPLDPDRVFEMTDMLDPEYTETLEKKLQECPTCEGTAEVPHKIRTVREVPCPKDKALVELLDENEDQGRLVVFAGFTGSVDRVTKLCLKEKWAVVRVDGRGWKVFDMDGNSIHKVDPLAYWADTHNNHRVVFVAHPMSGGMGLTLTESRMAVFYSNDFNPESRIQAEDRIHRMGTDENLGATIVDLIHLPTDERVRDILKDNRRLELMTMGDIETSVGVTDSEE
jgi:SNF2 family DNA or RNA helicase